MFERVNNGFMNSIPQVTKNLLIINFLLWLVMTFVPGFDDTLVRVLGLHYWESPDFNPIQLVTYMFVHGGFVHLFFNMFSLYMFGRLLERVWGAKRFLIFYFVCGIGAAFIQELIAFASIEYAKMSLPAEAVQIVYEEGYDLFNQNLKYVDSAMGLMQQSLYTPVVGASGAVFGILLGFAFVFPNMPLYLMFVPVPIKAKWMVIGYAALEFVFGVSGTMSSVAHFAHLGGMLFGLIILLYWKKKGTLGGNFFY